jgi:hypothetical protein
LQTHFHIDFDWWSHVDRDWRVYLRSYLFSEHQDAYADTGLDEMIDWVDPETAEVQQVDGVQHILISHCARQESFISEQTTLVDSVFRIFLANGNTPMTPVELAAALKRQPEMILRTLTGPRVYKGLRPCLD